MNRHLKPGPGRPYSFGNGDRLLEMYHKYIDNLEDEFIELNAYNFEGLKATKLLPKTPSIEGFLAYAKMGKRYFNEAMRNLTRRIAKETDPPEKLDELRGLLNAYDYIKTSVQAKMIENAQAGVANPGLTGRILSIDSEKESREDELKRLEIERRDLPENMGITFGVTEHDIKEARAAEKMLEIEGNSRTLKAPEKIKNPANIPKKRTIPPDLLEPGNEKLLGLWLKDNSKDSE